MPVATPQLPAVNWRLVCEPERAPVLVTKALVLESPATEPFCAPDTWPENVPLPPAVLPWGPACMYALRPSVRHARIEREIQMECLAPCYPPEASPVALLSDWPAALLVPGPSVAARVDTADAVSALSGVTRVADDTSELIDGFFPDAPALPRARLPPVKSRLPAQWARETARWVEKSSLLECMRLDAVRLLCAYNIQQVCGSGGINPPPSCC